MRKFINGNRKKTEDIHRMFFPEERKSSKWLVPIALALALTAGEAYLLDLANERKAHLIETRRNPGKESLLEQKCRADIPMDTAEAELLIRGCKEALR